MIACVIVIVVGEGGDGAASDEQRHKSGSHEEA